MHPININLSRINDSTFSKTNFLLFNLLISYSEQTTFQAGQTYVCDDQPLTLTHTLTVSDITPFTSGQAYTVLNDKDEIVGDLHLLDIGMVYFRDDYSLTRTNNIRADMLQQLMQEKIRDYILDEQFVDTRKNAWRYLLAAFKKVDVNNEALIRKYYAFYCFYSARLSDALMCASVKVKREHFGQLVADGLLKYFLLTSKDIPIYSPERSYFFQNTRICFQAYVIRRQRKENRGECFDLLSSVSVGSGGTSTVFRVKNVYVKDQSKTVLKHPYVYKISNSAAETLQDEFEETKKLTHLAKSRNYHPGFYAMPYLGQSLFDYLENHLFKLAAKKEDGRFIHEVLKLTVRLFSAVETQLKGQFHGDLKHDNFCIDKNGKVSVIDFSKLRYFTPVYASPEQLKNEMKKAVVKYLSDPSMNGVVMRFTPDNFTFGGDGQIQLKSEEAGDGARLLVSSGKRDNKCTIDYLLSDLLSEIEEEDHKSDIYSVARMLAEILNDPNDIWEQQDNFVFIFDAVVTEAPDDLLEGLFSTMRKKYTESVFPAELLRAYQALLRQCHASNPADRPNAQVTAEIAQAILNEYETSLNLKLKDEAPSLARPG